MDKEFFKEIKSEFDNKWEKIRNDYLNKEWESFRNELINSNRFFLTNTTITDKIRAIIPKLLLVIPPNTNLFRARKYNNPQDIEIFNYYEKMKEFLAENNDPASDLFLLRIIKNREEGKRFKTSFWGHDEEGSFVNKQSFVKGARANPEMIKYLYVADSKYTALTEVRPGLSDYISIADITLLRSLNIIDFSNCRDTDLTEEESKMFKLVSQIFSKIINDDSPDYLVTQYISELVKSCGADGIRYNSAMHSGGINYAIFNYNKCKAVRSNVFKMEDMYFCAERVGPIVSSQFRDQERILCHKNIKGLYNHSHK